MVCCVCLPACAADDVVTISDVEIGFAGALKVGRWTPVSFRVNGPPGTSLAATITAPDPDGSETVWTLPDTTIDESGSSLLRALFKIGRLEGVIRIAAAGAGVTIQARANPAADTLPCIPHTQATPFIGVLGPAPGFLAAFPPQGTEDAGSEGRAAARVLEFTAADDLPLVTDAYDALDVIVLSQQFDIDPERSAALAEWVRHGGHLVVALSSDPQAFTASPLSRWAPVTVREASQFGELAALVDRVPGSPPLAVSSDVRGVRIEPVGGLVLASSLKGPLATRAPYGLGRVTVLAVDWSHERFENWPGLPGLCRYLADLVPPARETVAGSNVQLRPTGVSELATQLASQLDHFGTVERPSYWTVIGFAAAFMVLVGPLDYLLVHRVLKQPRLTWFTFPAWIVFAAAAASFGADRLNSTERQANQFDLVDVDAATGMHRAQSWMTVYSPAPRRLRVEAAAAPWLAGDDPQQMQLGWSGTPESGFGGMYRAGGLNLANPPYTIGANSEAIQNVPIGQWSSKALAGNWKSLPETGSQPLVTSELADDGTGLLVGTFTHRLPDAITDWCVAYGAGAYFPRETTRVDRTPAIPPATAWSPSDGVSRRQLISYLQGLTQTYRATTKGAATDVASVSTIAYDPLGLDPLPFARMLTYYDVADGLDYTGLTNHSLQRHDLSHLLSLKRAVVFGRIASPAAQYEIDDAAVQPQERWTFVRLVLPVKPGQAPSLRDTGRLKIR